METWYTALKIIIAIEVILAIGCVHCLTCDFMPGLIPDKLRIKNDMKAFDWGTMLFTIVTFSSIFIGMFMHFWYCDIKQDEWEAVPMEQRVYTNKITVGDRSYLIDDYIITDKNEIHFYVDNGERCILSTAYTIEKHRVK